ncbi:hypothetical protein BJX62DRAFT_37629 [Aspergillus germanicus]
MSHCDSRRTMQPWAVPVDRRMRTWMMQRSRPCAWKKSPLAISVLAAMSGTIMILSS